MAIYNGTQKIGFSGISAIYNGDQKVWSAGVAPAITPLYTTNFTYSALYKVGTVTYTIDEGTTQLLGGAQVAQNTYVEKIALKMYGSSDDGTTASFFDYDAIHSSTVNIEITFESGVWFGGVVTFTIYDSDNNAIASASSNALQSIQVTDLQPGVYKCFMHAKGVSFPVGSKTGMYQLKTTIFFTVA